MLYRDRSALMDEHLEGGGIEQGANQGVEVCPIGGLQQFQKQEVAAGYGCNILGRAPALPAVGSNELLCDIKQASLVRVA
jgi:hypothetical protein